MREEIHHVREGKHGARSAKQAIAIGLSKARSAGVELSRRHRPAPASRRSEVQKSASRRASSRTRAFRETRPPSMRKFKREPRSAASRQALSRQAKTAARRRSPSARSAAAQKAARTRKRTQRAGALTLT